MSLTARPRLGCCVPEVCRYPLHVYEDVIVVGRPINVSSGVTVFADYLSVTERQFANEIVTKRVVKCGNTRIVCMCARFYFIAMKLR